MEPITARIPIFAAQAGRHILFGPQKTKGFAATFTVDPAQPFLLTISCPYFVLNLNRAGVKAGLDDVWAEPDGEVTVHPYQAPEVRWLIVDIDQPEFPAAQISATWARVDGFLALAEALLGFQHDDVFDALVPRPASEFSAEDWPQIPRRTDGGAW